MVKQNGYLGQSGGEDKLSGKSLWIFFTQIHFQFLHKKACRDLSKLIETVHLQIHAGMNFFFMLAWIFLVQEIHAGMNFLKTIGLDSYHHIWVTRPAQTSPDQPRPPPPSIFITFGMSRPYKAGYPTLIRYRSY